MIVKRLVMWDNPLKQLVQELILLTAVETISECVLCRQPLTIIVKHQPTHCLFDAP